MTDRETIELALQKVQSGELSPAEATKLLLASGSNASVTGEAHHESLASLLDRLGTPPPDIVTSWCQQLTQIACRYERETGENLPAIDLAHWSLTPRGELVWDGRQFDATAAEQQPSPSVSMRVEEFHAMLLPHAPTAAFATTDSEPPRAPIASSTDASTEEVRPPVEPTTTDAGIVTDAPTSSIAKPESPGGQGVHRTIRRALFAIAAAGCIAVAGYVLYDASRPEQTTAETTPSNTFTPGIASSELPARSGSDAGPTTEPVLSGSPDSAETLQTLETIESMSEAELSSIETAEIEMQPSFSLDDLMPPAVGFVPAADAELEAISDPAADRPPTNGSTEHSSTAPISDSVDEVLGGDDRPAESPQQTRISTVMAVELPNIEGHDGATSLSERKLSALKLDFPFDVPLSIDAHETTWEIYDSRKETAVAFITSGDRGTSLQWTEDAKQSPVAAALAHGRITADDRDTIFLRPIVEADPWPIRVDQPDVMPTWNLGYPIPPRVTRLSFEFELPDEIEEGWIEPIEPDSLRRGRGLAVLTPKEGESVSLGLRFDLRCSRKLSCRIRYAGRLDPSMPWQVVSVGLLEKFANQLTEQAILVSREADRLSRVYEIAGSSGRRILRVKQSRNDELADSIRTAADRVAQLQSLIAALESAGSIRLRVWVEWPNAQQDLLTMMSE